MDFALHVPINSVSFGAASVSLLREFFLKGYEPVIFPIGNQIDLSAQRIEQEFGAWLTRCLNKSLSTYKRKTPVVKLWHLNGSLESFGEKQILYTFHELDSLTREEINIAKNNNKVILSSKFSVRNFEDHGIDNTVYIPLGFDKFNFYVKNKPFFIDNRVTWNLSGKWEARKMTAKIIKAWNKKYGKNPKHFLTCAIFNPHLKPEDNNGFFNFCVDGNKPFNIDFLGFMQTNEMYNDYLNSGSIAIGMSGAESFDLPLFHSVALGKHAVVLNAHVYKDYCNKENAVMVNPTGKEIAEDNIFFKRGTPFNQGNWFTWNEDEFIAGLEEAANRFESNPVNENGLKLQNEYTYSNTADKILEVLRDV